MQKIILLLIGLVCMGMVYGDDEVRFDAAGQWVYATGNIPNKWEDKAIWVDVLVKDLAFDKTVGIRWTDDHWTSYQDHPLNFELSYNNGVERWGVDFAPLGRLSSYYIGGWYNYVTRIHRAGGSSVTMEFAIFYEVNGQIYWDNNHDENYTLELNLLR